MTKSFEPRPAFSAYEERLTARPVFQRIVAQNKKLTAEMKSAS